MTVQELQNRLNTAATLAGEAGVYALQHYTDQTDGYADYCGYVVTDGPDVERAHKWLCAAVAEEHAKKTKPASPGTTRYAEVRTTGKVTYVCTGRYWIGD